MKYFIIFWLVGSFCLAQVNESFDKANQLYNSGNYERALSTYTSILDASQHSRKRLKISSKESKV